MVTPRNDSVELAVVKDVAQLKHPEPSAPPEPTGGESRSKRQRRRRKRCCTIVSMVVLLLIAAGTGTILFYELLLEWLPAESNGHDFQPTPTEGAVTSRVGIVDRGPVMIDPYTEDPAGSTTDVIFIDSSTTDGGKEDSSEQEFEYSFEVTDTSKPVGSGDYEGGSGSGDDSY